MWRHSLLTPPGKKTNNTLACVFTVANVLGTCQRYHYSLLIYRYLELLFIMYFLLQLDLGWVWGNEASMCRPGRPERTRARRMVTVPPPVSSTDMDTGDSGVGTAEGDLVFAAPYPPCLPTTTELEAASQTTSMLTDVSRLPLIGMKQWNKWCSPNQLMEALGWVPVAVTISEHLTVHNDRNKE